MGATKSYEFSVKENKLAKYAKALAHPARIAILKLWLKSKPVCVAILLKNYRFHKVPFPNI